MNNAKKNKLRKQIAEAKDRIAKMKVNETAAPAKTFGLANLMESELDKAELVLAVKSISDELQQIAEKVAKMEAEEIMPIIDSLKASFGPDLSQSFNKVASDSLRALVESIKSAKDAIGNEILRLEGAADGQQVNDIAMTPDEPETPDMGGDDMGDMGADVGADAGMAADADMGDAPALGGGPAPDMDDMGDMGDDDYVDPAAGRAKKESAEFRHANNPDKFVFEAVVSRIREGSKGADAARAVAENLGLDLSDVVEIIAESRAKSRISEGSDKKFVITVKNKKHKFDTLPEAKEKAEEIFQKTGIVVGIEQE